MRSVLCAMAAVLVALFVAQVSRAGDCYGVSRGVVAYDVPVVAQVVVPQVQQVVVAQPVYAAPVVVQRQVVVKQQFVQRQFVGGYGGGFVQRQQFGYGRGFAGRGFAGGGGGPISNVINAANGLLNSPAGQFALGAFVANGFRFGR